MQLSRETGLQEEGARRAKMAHAFCKAMSGWKDLGGLLEEIAPRLEQCVRTELVRAALSLSLSLSPRVRQNCMAAF
jgi:hypothetical protein